MDINARIRLAIGDLVVTQIMQQDEIERLKAELNLLKQPKQENKVKSSQTSTK
jgi:uncharacterized small protein (DUF1192 family)